MASSSQHRCVFVGNIPYDASEEQLVQICEEVGPVVSFRLVLDRETGKPKGYGFCEYMDEETALSARRNLQGYEINGRQLRVDFAENDKGNDRNREQGRGGPGLPSNTDAQRTLSGPSALGNSASNQPLGIPLAANAASVMVGVLGGHQTMPAIHGIQNQPVSGNDPLTHYLAKMTKSQLQEIVSEMKALATQDKTLAQQVLQTNPQLSKALFQAEIILGMVTPQMLQMPHTQKPGNPMLQNQVSRDGQPISFPYNAQPPALPNLSQVGAFSGSQGGQALIQPPLVPQEAPSQARFQFQQEIQPPVPLHGTALGQSAVPTAPRMQHATLSNVSRPPTVPVPSTRAPPVQPPPQQSKPNVVTDIGYNQLPTATSSNTSIQRPVLLTPAAPQNGPSNYPVNVGGLERANGLHSSITPSTEQILKRSSTSELARHPSKLTRLDDGSRAPHALNSSTHMATSAPAQGFTPTLESGEQTVNGGGMQTPEKFLPPAEQALLDQVMSLTPEQLSSLPPDQRQQVIQLQQMLRS